MGLSRRYISFEEFKKMTILSSSDSSTTEKNDSEKIEERLRSYEASVNAPGAIHVLHQDCLTSSNKKYERWLREQLIHIAANNPNALKPHPALFYSNIHKGSRGCWFMGTTNEYSARKALLKFSKKEQVPIMVKKHSLNYIHGYARLKNINRYNDYKTFVARWQESIRPYPDKDDTYFIVATQCMWICNHEKDFDEFRGQVDENIFTVVLSRLTNARDAVLQQTIDK